MPRIVKDPDIRRLEVMAAAKKLFEKLGYETTSVENIIKEAGIAKGTFYYYFKAKKDILRALVEQIANEMITYFNSIVEDQDLSALEKLQLLLKNPKKNALVNSSVMRIIHHPENRELQEQLNVQSIKTIAPLLTQVLVQGYEEKTFKKAATVESIQLILAGSQFILESGLFKWPPKKRMEYLKTLQNFLEYIVGAKPGLLNFIVK